MILGALTWLALHALVIWGCVAIAKARQWNPFFAALLGLFFWIPGLLVLLVLAAVLPHPRPYAIPPNDDYYPPV